MATREQKAIEEATQLAIQYQLVTPASGAVVLETQQQYDQAGLQPVEAGTVPTIPEPETLLLIMVVATIFLWMLWRRKPWRRQFSGGSIG